MDYLRLRSFTLGCVVRDGQNIHRRPKRRRRKSLLHKEKFGWEAWTRTRIAKSRDRNLSLTPGQALANKRFSDLTHDENGTVLERLPNRAVARRFSDYLPLCHDRNTVCHFLVFQDANRTERTNLKTPLPQEALQRISRVQRAAAR